jgi:hypothetical protein
LVFLFGDVLCVREDPASVLRLLGEVLTLNQQAKRDTSKDDSKVDVEIFTSLGGCGCSGPSFLDRVWNVLLEFGDRVRSTTKSLDTPEADQYHVVGSFVVVDGQTVLGRNSSEASLRAAINQALLRTKGPAPQPARRNVHRT